MILGTVTSLPLLLRMAPDHAPVTVCDRGKDGTLVRRSSHDPSPSPDFEGLVTEHADVVWRFAMGMLRNHADADDATQETFARAYAAVDGFRGDSSVRTWLLSICRNLCLDHIRRRREVTVGGGAELAAAGPDRDHAEDVAIRAVLRQGVAGLEDEQREAFVLVDVLGFPATEAAEICGVPPTTLRSRRQRAHEALIARLAEEVT